MRKSNRNKSTDILSNLFKELHDLNILLYPGIDTKSTYFFYYDEAFNPRKLYIKEKSFNSDISYNFTLGGIVCSRQEQEVADLDEIVRLSKTNREIKLKSIANGDFINCLLSSKLTTFLKYLDDKDLLIHFFSVNLLYYSIVDIVDSIINSSINYSITNQDLILYLKNLLYKLSKIELKSLSTLFFKFGYPNIKQESLENFLIEFNNLFETHQRFPEYRLGLRLLNSIVNEIIFEKKDLPLLSLNKDSIILEDFSSFYLRPLYLYPNSYHYFDNEMLIAKRLAEIFDGHSSGYSNFYYFINSQENNKIQFSDVVVGLVSKFSKFIHDKNLNEIGFIIKNLTDTQKKNFHLFSILIYKSKMVNSGFIDYIESLDEIQKIHWILNNYN